jgi:hypothetical protein
MQFEIWTNSGRPILSFDSEIRAREEFARRRIPKARLVRVTRLVEELK